MKKILAILTLATLSLLSAFGIFNIADIPGFGSYGANANHQLIPFIWELPIWAHLAGAFGGAAFAPVAMKR